MTDGQQLKRFIDNQSRSKISIAKALGISRQALFQYFQSKTLNEETKKRFEKYFDKTIFTDNINEVNEPDAIWKKPTRVDRGLTDNEKAQDALIDMLILEVAKLKSKAYGYSVDDAIDELEKNARIALRQIEKGAGA